MSKKTVALPRSRGYLLTEAGERLPYGQSVLGENRFFCCLACHDPLDVVTLSAAHVADARGHGGRYYWPDLDPVSLRWLHAGAILVHRTGSDCPRAAAEQGIGQPITSFT